MNATESIRERLLAHPHSKNAQKTLEFLEKQEARPVSSQPATVTVSEALRLWRTRLKNIEYTKAPIAGVEELLAHLENMAPQRKIDQFGFIGPEAAVTVFFARNDGAYVGSAISDRRRSSIS